MHRHKITSHLTRLHRYKPSVQRKWSCAEAAASGSMIVAGGSLLKVAHDLLLFQDNLTRSGRLFEIRLSGLHEGAVGSCTGRG